MIPRRAVAVLGLAACLGACDREVVVGYDDQADRALPPVSWTSGAHVGNDLMGYEQFEALRERPLDLAMFFLDRTVGWGGLVTPEWPIDMLAGFEPRLVLAEPLYPEGAGSNEECASGAYDEHWSQLGPFLSARGRGDSIIRLGWGPNDVAHDWRADADPSTWVECYRRVVEAIRAGGPDLEIAWDFNRAGRPDTTSIDPYAAYPGDAYVDYVGIEAFDRYPASLDEADWQTTCESETGLCSVIEFARQRGKRLGVSEWGVVSCGEERGGDNPLFVRKMFELFANNADVMGYELYYDSAGDVCSTLLDDTKPMAAEQYRTLYSR